MKKIIKATPIKVFRFILRKVRNYRRKICLKKSDILIVSYPKSGRTWLKMILGNYLIRKYKLPSKNHLSTYEITKTIKNIDTTFVTHYNSHLTYDMPYQSYSFDNNLLRKKKIILLTRNVKDVVVSAYYQYKFRDEGNSFKGNISEFLRDGRYGIKKIDAFNKYWLNNAESFVDFLNIHYEALHSSPLDEVAKLLIFIGEKNIDYSILENAIKDSSFEKMRNIEKTNKRIPKTLQPKNKNNIRSYKTRKGKIGSYKEELAKEDLEYIENIINEK